MKDAGGGGSDESCQPCDPAEVRRGGPPAGLEVADNRLLTWLWMRGLSDFGRPPRQPEQLILTGEHWPQREALLRH